MKLDKRSTTFLLLMFINVIFLTACGNHVNNEDNGWEEYNLIGKVKSLNEKTYIAEVKEGMVIKSDQKKEIYVPSDFNVEFDNKGNMLERVMYNPNGSVGNRYLYEYDVNNNLIKRTWYKGGGAVIIDEYVYNDEGKLIEINEYDGDGNVMGRDIYTIDDDSNSKERKMYDEKGEVTQVLISKYDHKENLIELIDRKERGGDLISYFEYDDKNQLIDFKSYAEGNLVWQTTASYKKNEIERVRSFKTNEGLTAERYIERFDDKKNLLEEVWYDKNGDLSSKAMNKYKFDNKGNWIERIEYVDDQPRYVVERKIQYY